MVDNIFLKIASESGSMGFGPDCQYEEISAENVDQALRESADELVDFAASLEANKISDHVDYTNAAKEMQIAGESAVETFEETDPETGEVYVTSEAAKDSLIRGAYQIKGGVVRAVQTIIRAVGGLFKFSSGVKADMTKLGKEVDSVIKKLDAAKIDADKEFKLKKYSDLPVKNIVDSIIGTGAADNKTINGVISDLKKLETSALKHGEIPNKLESLCKSVGAVLVGYPTGKGEVLVSQGEITASKEAVEKLKTKLTGKEYLKKCKEYLDTNMKLDEGSEFKGTAAKTHMISQLKALKNTGIFAENKSAGDFAKLNALLNKASNNLQSAFGKAEPEKGSQTKAIESTIAKQSYAVELATIMGSFSVQHRTGAIMGLKRVKAAVTSALTEGLKVASSATSVSKEDKK